MTIRLLLLGTSAFAPEVADLISDIVEPKYEIAGFVQNLPPYEPNTTFLGRPIYWVDELKDLADSHQVVCTLGTTRRAAFIQQVENFGMRFATIIHPTARISRTASIGAGSIISAGVIIAANAVIGRHVIVNRGALLGHDTVIEDVVTIGPGANLAGVVIVGTRTLIGMGALVLERRRIGSYSIIGAGSLVTHDVPDRVKVMGSPARIVAENIDGL